MNFSELVSEYLKHHTNRELANEFECAPATVTRWASGVSKPLPGMQKIVTDHIEKIRKTEGW